MRRGREEDLVSGRAVDGESEGRRRVIEPDVGGERSREKVCLRAREDIFGHFVPFVGWVGDFDMNAVLCSEYVLTKFCNEGHLL